MILPQTSTCVKNHGNGTKWMYFLIEDGELSDIWSKDRNSIQKK